MRVKKIQQLKEADRKDCVFFKFYRKINDFLSSKPQTNRVNKVVVRWTTKIPWQQYLNVIKSNHRRCRTFRRREETFSRTMGTMRNNFAAVFVLHILMHSTSQSLSLRGTNGNSPKKNSLPSALTLEPRSTSSTIYECLFVDPDLPACDVKW